MELELGEANLLETSWALEPERLALEAQINNLLPVPPFLPSIPCSDKLSKFLEPQFPHQLNKD